MGELVIGVLCLVGSVFAASGAAKLRGRQAYRSFRVGLRETMLVPGRLLPAVAATLASIEALVAAGLIAAAATVASGAATTFPEVTLAAAALLTVALVTGVTAVMRSGTKARCACFGSRSARLLGWVHLSRNIGILVAEVCGLVACPLSRPPTAAGSLFAAVAGGVAAVLFIHADDMADLFAPASTAQARRGSR